MTPDKTPSDALAPCPFCGAPAHGYAIEPHSHSPAVLRLVLALGQPMGNGQDQAAGRPSAQGDKLLTVAERNIRSFLRSATFKSESDREAALNCVDILWEAARAAESVPAVGYPPLPDFDSGDEPIWEAIFNWKAATPGSDAHRKANAIESAIINQLRAYVDAYVDADRAARAPADSVLEDAARDHIRALIAQHADILEQNESAYFELCYHRATGWMAWITDKPLCMPPVINPGRTVLAQGQGDTPDEACADAARKQRGAT